jgi:hypothetical protein
MNLSPSQNKFPGSTLILKVVIRLAIRGGEAFGVGRHKKAGSLCSLVDSLDCKTPIKVIPLHGTSEPARKSREPHFKIGAQKG